MGLQAQIASALDEAGLTTSDYKEVGTDSWPSAFAVSDLAVASIGAACAELASLSGRDNSVVIDRRLASLWFSLTAQPQGWTLPPVWDDLAGVYKAKDGFIRLHTNAPHHKAAAVRVLGVLPDREAVETAVSGWLAEALETEIVRHQGCAARLMSLSEWQSHPQRKAVAAEPLIDWRRGDEKVGNWQPGSAEKPLAGLKVLDLTRVLAGPVCTRTLAGFGATVLRIDPPGWSEALVETEVTCGKRLATLDLKTEGGRAQILELLKEADVFIHGYRADALEGLGLGDAVRWQVNPGLIDVALNAYGWTGPWKIRRGFDSLVQMSSGIAHTGMVWAGTEAPHPLPVQALDFATGYLMAAATIRAVRVRQATGKALSARLSLARTAALLTSVPPDNQGEVFAPVQEAEIDPRVELSDWGPLKRVRFPADLPTEWRYPARRLHQDAPNWS